MGYTVPATEEHARALAKILRSADRDEIIALTGQDPEAVLLEHIHGDFGAHAMFSQSGELAGMCGLHPEFPDLHNVPEGMSVLPAMRGRVWMIGSPVLDAHPVEFLRASKDWLQSMMTGGFVEVTNFVDARNTARIVWLQALGFTVDPATVPHGAKGLPFHPASLRPGALWAP